MELLIVLPVFLLLAVMVPPFLKRAIAPPWLDERLYLDARTMRTDLDYFLAEAHPGPSTPPYFPRNSVRDIDPGIRRTRSIPPLGRFYPGDPHFHRAVLEDETYLAWDSLFLGSPPDGGGHLEREMMVFSPGHMEEFSVRATVGEMTLAGSLAALLRPVRKLGIEVVHVNLDSLPPERKSNGKP